LETTSPSRERRRVDLELAARLAPYTLRRCCAKYQRWPTRSSSLAEPEGARQPRDRRVRVSVGESREDLGSALRGVVGHDLLLSGVVTRGTVGQPQSVRDGSLACPSLFEISHMVLSRGMELRLHTCPETLEYLRLAGVTVHVEETKQAVRIYNQLVRRGELVGGVFHSTC
jgi:hypothetical protein